MTHLVLPFVLNRNVTISLLVDTFNYNYDHYTSAELVILSEYLSRIKSRWSINKYCDSCQNNGIQLSDRTLDEYLNSGGAQPLRSPTEEVEEDDEAVNSESGQSSIEQAFLGSKNEEDFEEEIFNFDEGAYPTPAASANTTSTGGDTRKMADKQVPSSFLASRLSQSFGQLSLSSTGTKPPQKNFRVDDGAQNEAMKQDGSRQFPHVSWIDFDNPSAIGMIISCYRANITVNEVTAESEYDCLILLTSALIHDHKEVALEVLDEAHKIPLHLQMNGVEPNGALMLKTYDHDSFCADTRNVVDGLVKNFPKISKIDGFYSSKWVGSDGSFPACHSVSHHSCYYKYLLSSRLNCTAAFT
jgi:hypothetical protein